VDLGRDPAAGGIGQALLFPGCANFQPLQYINALAKAITGKYGGRIFENSRVTKMNGKHVRLP
jgi:glycine/D-amino acid oxidase-like deaminating enzyme